jgi:hypothetical protein
LLARGVNAGYTAGRNVVGFDSLSVNESEDFNSNVNFTVTSYPTVSNSYSLSELNSIGKAK